MTLRILLVGLVASLGFEPSNGPDVSRWAQAGAAWVRARLIDHSVPASGPAACLAEATDCHQVLEDDEPAVDPQVDVAAEAASQGMVAELMADLAVDHSADQPEDEAMVAQVTPSTGLPEGEEVACLVVEIDEATSNPPAAQVEDEVEVEVEALEPEDESAEAPEGLDRVSSAVRLTREALQAWASLIQPADDCQPSR